MSGNYKLAPIFLIRAAGVPFDILKGLETCETAKLARELLAARNKVETARSVAEGLLGSREAGLSAESSRRYRAVLKRPISLADDGPYPSEITDFANAASAAGGLEKKLQETLHRELDLARVALFEASQRILPAYLIFGAGGFSDRVNELLVADTGALPSRNSRVRERERHLVLYLQRVCAKNDTFSEFGPSGWGRVGEHFSAISLSPKPAIASRQAFLERWAAQTLASAIMADPEALMELRPRLNPVGRLEENEFVLTDSGERLSLDATALDVAKRCDGKTAAHILAGKNGILEHLAEHRVILWQAEVPALEANAFDVLVSDIREWRDTPTRSAWLEHAGEIAALPKQFATTSDLPARAALMSKARRLLGDLGSNQTGGRSLYAATNPVAEECFRDCDFHLNHAMTDGLTPQIEPWLDLWRDTYAYVASRVAAGLRDLMETAPMRDGALPLPAFLAHCAANKMPLTGFGIVALAHLAFQEVKAAFREMVRERPDAPEWELTAEDCAFVRRRFEFPPFDEYTFPSADLQISAASVDAINRGDYQWIVGELHPPVAMLHHALFWSCPDPALLSDALASTACGRPGMHYGFFAADFTAHTVVRHMDALPALMTFLAPQRSNSRWRTIPPAETEVYVEEGTGDVCVRARASREHLGSFARAWVIPLGFHPFLFGRPGHMPRLRCGDAIVQRRAWTVDLNELTPGNYTGVSGDLVLAIEKLRVEKDWPRFIYIRPTEQALRRSGAEGRDKDTKPVFIDLESYLFLEIFHRWLNKAGELEVTEMLPDPEHLCWQEPDGRRTFELRTLIVPRS